MYQHLPKFLIKLSIVIMVTLLTLAWGWLRPAPTLAFEVTKMTLTIEETTLSDYNGGPFNQINILSSAIITVPNLITVEVQHNLTGSTTSNFTIPAGADYANLSGYTGAYSTTLATAYDWYSTFALADLNSSRVFGVVASTDNNSTTTEQEYAFSGVPFGTNVSTLAVGDTDAATTMMDYSITSGGGTLTLSEVAGADRKITYLAEFYDYNTSMQLLSTNKLFFTQTGTTSKTQSIPANTDVIILTGFFGGNKDDAGSGSTEFSHRVRFIIDLEANGGNGLLIGRLAGVAGRSDDELINYGVTRNTALNSVSPGGLTSTADGSVTRIGDSAIITVASPSLFNATDLLLDPDIFVNAGKTTLTIDHAPSGSATTFAANNIGGYAIEYYQRLATASPNVFITATVASAEAGGNINFAIPTTPTPGYGYVHNLSHNGTLASPSHEDKDFFYGLVDLDNSISSGVWHRNQGADSIANLWRRDKAWQNVPINTILSGYRASTKDESRNYEGFRSVSRFSVGQGIR